MDPMIEKYRMLYAKDLSQHVGLNENHLPNALTFSVLLNPMFGLEQRIVGSGLLTKEQFYRAKRGKSFLFFRLYATTSCVYLNTSVICSVMLDRTYQSNAGSSR